MRTAQYPKTCTMKTFYVLLMRDKRLLEEHSDFRSLQDLQYIAGPIQAKDYLKAAELAKRELRRRDRECKLDHGELTVIGHIEDGAYRPWFNPSCP